jgi:hypothetical protein
MSTEGLIPDVEHLIKLELARDLFPGRPVIQTLRRWARVGVKTKAGFIRLRYLKCGRGKFTTKLWVAQFIQAQTMAAIDMSPQSITRDELIRRQSLETTSAVFDGELLVSAQDCRRRGHRRVVTEAQRAAAARLPKPAKGLPFSLD